MAFPSYSTGTVSVSAGGTVITGVGTLWTSTNVVPGDDIVIAGQTVIVMDFTDATHLTINAWPGSNVTSAAYKLVQRSPLRYNASQTMMDVSSIVAALNTDGFYFFVSSVETVPNPSYGNEGQYAFQATTGKLWLKSGGIWIYIGTNKGFGLTMPWSSSKAYNTYDTVSSGGSTYICILAHTNQIPPNATYWTLIASIGQAATVAVGTVTTLAGGAAATVTNAGTAGAATFNFGIPQGKSYAATSSTSFTVGSGSKAFSTQAGLAYTNGARVRASSAANTSNWMEGVSTYAGTVLTINVDKFNGSGTLADWNFNLAGQPGAGDLSSANNLSDVSNKQAGYDNLSLYGGSIASAANMNLNTTTGNFVYITGATQINNIALAQGLERTILFDPGIVLSTTGNLLLPGGRARTTVSGDMAIIKGGSGVVYFSSYERMVGPVQSINIQKFLTAGSFTYTPTPGTVYAIVECVGGGGAGGGANGEANAIRTGAGGGAGSYSRSLLNAAAIGASKAVVIGAGGTGVSGVAGNDGNNTTFGGTLVVATKGSGGAAGNTSTFPSAGLGGVPGTGDFAPGGSPGESGFISATGYNINFFAGGNGGASVYGGAGRATVGASFANGNPATGYGSGGSGGFSTNGIGPVSGGAGGQGCMLITEYINA